MMKIIKMGLSLLLSESTILSCNLYFIGIGALRIFCLNFASEEVSTLKNALIAVYSSSILLSCLLFLAISKKNTKFMYFFEFIYGCYFIAKVFMIFWVKSTYQISLNTMFLLFFIMIFIFEAAFFIIILLYILKVKKGKGKENFVILEEENEIEITTKEKTVNN